MKTRKRTSIGNIKTSQQNGDGIKYNGIILVGRVTVHELIHTFRVSIDKEFYLEHATHINDDCRKSISVCLLHFPQSCFHSHIHTRLKLISQLFRFPFSTFCTIHSCTLTHSFIRILDNKCHGKRMFFTFS